MSNDILFSLWFFVPAGLANMTPILVAHAPGLRNLNAPIDFGRRIRGKRIFGSHKTWRGILSGLIVGAIIAALQAILYRHESWIVRFCHPLSYAHFSVVVLGLLLSFGALFGDSIESMLKRQLNIDSGRSWFPFDQLDYIVGGLVLSLFYIRLPLIDYVWIVLIWFALHLLFSYIGFLLKLKAKRL